jgi:hypothetical protein
MIELERCCLKGEGDIFGKYPILIYLGRPY